MRATNPCHNEQYTMWSVEPYMDLHHLLSLGQLQYQCCISWDQWYFLNQPICTDLHVFDKVLEQVCRGSNEVFFVYFTPIHSSSCCLWCYNSPFALSFPDDSIWEINELIDDIPNWVIRGTPLCTSAKHQCPDTPESSNFILIVTSWRTIDVSQWMAKLKEHAPEKSTWFNAVLEMIPTLSMVLNGLKCRSHYSAHTSGKWKSIIQMDQKICF